MTVKLALRKHDKRWFAKAICWWTGSIYSHCELVVDDICYSSSVMDGGVRAKQINLDPTKWDIIDLPWADASKVISYFEKTQYNPYGWLQLLSSQLLNRNTGSDDGDFCSNWCAEALGLPNPLTLSPGTLGVFCSFLSEFLYKFHSK